MMFSRVLFRKPAVRPGAWWKVSVLAAVLFPVHPERGRAADRPAPQPARKSRWEMRARPIAPGVTLEIRRRTPGPREVRVVRIRRAHPHIFLDVGVARGSVKGVERVPGIVTRATRRGADAVAAVNGDFFHMAGQPWAGLALGPVVRAGEWFQSGAGRAAFYITADGSPHIGPLEPRATITVSGHTLTVTRINRPPVDRAATLYTEHWGRPVQQAGVLMTASDLPLRTHGRWRGTVTGVIAAHQAVSVEKGQLFLAFGAKRPVPDFFTAGRSVRLRLRIAGLDQPVRSAVGGGPILLRAGKIVPRAAPGTPRHPRTAVGYNAEEIILMTVDGRQPGWSLGLTLHDLAAWMRELGCTEALNLDGGGSTTAWVRGKIVNRPSDGWLRPVANALIVYSTAPHGPPARIMASPRTVAAFPGVAARLEVRVTDASYNPVAAPASDIVAESATAPGAPPIEARYNDNALVLTGGPGEALVTLRYRPAPEVRTRIHARVVTACTALPVDPPTAYLCTGEEAAFTAAGKLADGVRVAIPQNAIQWKVEGAGKGVVMTGPGRFRAVLPGVRAGITARLGAVAGHAVIYVAAERSVESFEHGRAARFTTYPVRNGGVTGAFERVHGPDAPEGRWWGRMTFDLGAGKGTRAAYIRLDRRLGAALRLSFQARLTGPAPVWLRLAILDGNGSRETFTVAAHLKNDGQWRRLMVRLPNGVKPPVTWQSIYVVALGGRKAQGVLDVDGLRVSTVPSSPSEKNANPGEQAP